MKQNLKEKFLIELKNKGYNNESLKDIKEFLDYMDERCPNCVNAGLCLGSDYGHSCKNYKKDPPDGGYYG